MLIIKTDFSPHSRLPVLSSLQMMLRAPSPGLVRGCPCLLMDFSQPFGTGGEAQGVLEGATPCPLRPQSPKYHGQWATCQGSPPPAPCPWMLSLV